LTTFYTLTKIYSPVAAQPASAAYGINASGQVVGEFGSIKDQNGVSVLQDYRAFLWTPDSPNGTTGSAITLQPNPGDLESVGRGINSAGEVVGTTATEYDRYFLGQAASWQNGSLQLLGTLSDGDHALAYSVNDSGQAVGISGYCTGSLCMVGEQHINNHAFFYTPGVGMLDLGTLGGVESHAFTFNDTQIVGDSATTGPAPPHAAVWTSTTPGFMPSLLVSGDMLSHAWGINASGQIVGTVNYSSQHDPGVGFFMNNSQAQRPLTMNLLHPVPGEGGVAYRINSTGQAVGAEGYSGDPPNMIPFNPQYALFWDTSNLNQQPLDLNGSVCGTTDLRLVSAEAINDVGQIVGHGVDSTGNFVAFLLTPSSCTGPSGQPPVGAIPGLAVAAAAIQTAPTFVSQTSLRLSSATDLVPDGPTRMPGSQLARFDPTEFPPAADTGQQLAGVGLTQLPIRQAETLFDPDPDLLALDLT
jgi:probable HAF family extracellular repeat protein